MMSSKTKYIWSFSLLLFCIFIGIVIKYPLIANGSYDILKAIGFGMGPFWIAGIFALIYAAINRFKAEKMTAVYCVWTAGVIVFLLINLTAG